MFSCELPVPNGISDEKLQSIRTDLSTQEQRIVTDFYQIAVNAFMQKETSDTFWTDSIKRALEAHAHEQGFLCCHSGNTGEWLFDICWAELSPSASQPDQWKSATRLRMVCESEWSEIEDEILWDFMKLSWANADLRLFVYTNHMKRGLTEHPALLCRRNCPPAQGSRFLLIGFPKKVEADETFRVDAWTA